MSNKEINNTIENGSTLDNIVLLIKLIVNA